jgi:hypothetical protein
LNIEFLLNTAAREKTSDCYTIFRSLSKGSVAKSVNPSVRFTPVFVNPGGTSTDMSIADCPAGHVLSACVLLECRPVFVAEAVLFAIGCTFTPATAAGGAAVVAGGVEAAVGISEVRVATLVAVPDSGVLPEQSAEPSAVVVARGGEASGGAVSASPILVVVLLKKMALQFS